MLAPSVSITVLRENFIVLGTPCHKLPSTSRSADLPSSDGDVPVSTLHPQQRTVNGEMRVRRI